MSWKQGWLGRGAVGLAALMLLTHCGGGVEAREQGAEAPRPEASATREQGLVTTLTFGASADARVEAGSPTANFGGSSLLIADLSPRIETYLRFSITGVTGTVSRATLRLYATDGTSDGPRVYAAAGGWTEPGLTWNNRPALTSGPLDDEGAISSGTWVEYDVTGAVGGDGELNLAVIATSGNGADFHSREASRTDLRPQLLVTFEPSDCMPRKERDSFSSTSFDDAYVSLGSPTRNFGLEPVLLVDGSPRLESYLRFDVFDTGMNIVDARLVLHAFDSTSDGPLLYRASDAWSETGLTWNTRPGLIGGPLGDAGAISAGSAVTYDLRGVVTGPGSYSFALVPESDNGVDFYSTDSGDYTRFPELRFTAETPLYCSYRGTAGGRTGWARRIGGVGGERLRAMATDSAGGFVTAGLFGNAVFPEGEGFALARYSAEGTHLWTRVFATDDVYVADVAVTPLGNILVMGNYEGSPDLGTGPLPPLPDGLDDPTGFFIAKYTPDGALVWLRHFVARADDGYSQPVFPGEVTTDASGSVIITGGFLGTLDLGGAPLVRTEEGTPGFIAKFSFDGEHLWSRAFQTEYFFASALASTVATDPAGNILVGGQASSFTDLGRGPLGASGPFIAKYTPAGSLLWARQFSGVDVEGGVTSVRAVDAETVAFTANLGGTFTFGGRTYTVGDPDHPLYRQEGIIATLSAAGADGWLRHFDRVYYQRLTVGPGGALTATGWGFDVFDLGGGPLGTESLYGSSTFAVRYSRTGSHRWSRIFDPDLSLPELGQQPDGSVVLGGLLYGEAELDGRLYNPSGDRDLFFLQLKP